MVPVSKAAFAAGLWPGINAWFQLAYNKHPAEYVELFDTYSSSKAVEEDIGVVGLGLASVVADGAAVPFDGMEQSFRARYNNVKYGLGFIITDEAIEDDQYEIVGRMKAEALGFSMAQTKERVAANVYNRAFNSSYTGLDSVEMCSTAHLQKSGGTFANELTTAADISNAALEQMAIDIGKMTNDRGLNIAIRPQSLIIPVEQQFVAERILMSPLEPGNSNNDINAVRASGIIPRTIVNHYLTDADAWFVRTDCPSGMKHFERRADTFTEDNEFTTDNLRYKATARYSFGWTDPRGIFGSPGA